MQKTPISLLKTKIGQKTQIAGFVETIRNQGKIKFLNIRDVTGTIQVVAKENPPESDSTFEKISKLTLESVVSIEGLVKEEAQAPQGLELSILNLQILSLADPELPIPVNYEKSGGEAEITKRFDYRWLDLRHPEKHLIFKIWTQLEEGFRQYFLANDFIQIYTPSFMNSPSESGAEVFEVKYFNTKAYLAQSPQFYKQMAMASGMEKVFMTGPVYRAEPSFTTRHLTEFIGWDFEMAYISSPEEVMDTLESAIVSGFQRLKDTVLPNLDVPTKPFPRLEMQEIKQKLALANIPSEKEHDLSPEEEREICKLVKKETGHDFVFATNWHKDSRPFYHMRYEDRPEITKSFDLLYKGVEITSGAQREHRLEVLEAQIKEKGLSPEAFQDYLQFFKYGCPPHGGAGIGPGRIITQLLDLPSIKEVAFLPRDVKRLRP